MSAPLVLAPEEGARRNPAIAALGDPAHDIRVGLIVGFLCILLFASFALVAPGEVSVAGDKVAIQPVSGGIVTQVLVREGQQVATGQPLIRLNGVRSGGQLRQAPSTRMGARRSTDRS